MTSTSFNGNLGGIAGADQRCQTAATAGNKGGTWIALLGTSTISGVSRVTATGPWFQEQSNGTFVLTYNNAANLQTGALSPLNTDEQGRSPSTLVNQSFWSGMRADATTASSCLDWTATQSGGFTVNGTYGDGTSLGGFSAPCTSSYRLLCLEQ